MLTIFFDQVSLMPMLESMAWSMKSKTCNSTFKSIHICKFYLILFYHLKTLLYQLYNIILQYTQHPNFYFPILLIKIIYLYNKIYFFLFFYPIFSSTCICTFQTPPYLYFSPSSRLLHFFFFSFFMFLFGSHSLSDQPIV